MKKYVLFVVFTVAIAFAALFYGAPLEKADATPPVSGKGQYYAIDNDQTHIKFASKMCEPDLLMGEFHKVNGRFYLDEKTPEDSWVEIDIDAASATFNKEYHREDHIETIVEGEKFLNVATFPDIKFRSTDIKKTSEFTALVTGDMTLVGETHPITLEITFHHDSGMTTKGRKVAAFSAFGTFKRSDFKIMYALDRVGIRRIGDEVTMMISVAGNRITPDKVSTP